MKPDKTTAPESAPPADVMPESAPLNATAPESAPLNAAAPESAPLNATAPDSAPLNATAPESAPPADVTPDSAPLNATEPDSAPAEFKYLSRWTVYRTILADRTPDVVKRLETGTQEMPLSKRASRELNAAAHCIARIPFDKVSSKSQKRCEDIYTIWTWHAWLYAAEIITQYASPKSGLKGLIADQVFCSTDEYPIVWPDFWPLASKEREIIREAVSIMDMAVTAMGWIARGAEWAGCPIAQLRISVIALAQKAASEKTTREPQSGVSEFVRLLEPDTIIKAVELSGEKAPSRSTVYRWINEKAPNSQFWKIKNAPQLRRWAKRLHETRETQRDKRLKNKYDSFSAGSRELHNPAVIPFTDEIAPNDDID